MPKRTVISWIGWDVPEPIEILDEDWEAWENAVYVLAATQGLRVERMGNPIDLIFGKYAGNVYPKEFYEFQTAFEAMHEEIGFKVSGQLWLMMDDNSKVPFNCCESYKNGRRVWGDSIGRPARHSIGYARAEAKRKATSEAGLAM